MGSSQASNHDQWNAKAYQGAANFVPLLTTKVLQYLDPQETENILDIGCGDGVLDAQIALKCRSLVGLDSSASFIKTCDDEVTSKHPTTLFLQHDCRRLDYDLYVQDHPKEPCPLDPGRYDKVFSNAAMHWILRDEPCRKPFFKDVAKLLVPGGKFIFEMGGFQNVPEVHVALRSVLMLKYGIRKERLEEAGPWFFPSVRWMQTTLEETGFEVEVLESEHRPTKLTENNADGSGGLAGWLRLMGANFLQLLDSNEQRNAAIKDLCEVLGPVVTDANDGSQWLSYVRLRAVARIRG